MNGVFIMHKRKHKPEFIVAIVEEYLEGKNNKYKLSEKYGIHRLTIQDRI